MKITERLTITATIIVTMLSILGSIIAGCKVIDNRFAHAESVKILQITINKLSRRLNNKIQNDKLYESRKRILNLEERYLWKIENMPPEIFKIYKQLSEEYDRLKKELEVDELEYQRNDLK